MEENRQKNSKRRLNSLILLVAFTAIMLIVSTYAWFSTQRNVSISNLKGTVKVAEGLEISLDASHWSQEVDFAQYADQTTLKKLYGSTEHNVIPTEMLPVSSNGEEGVGQAEIPFYRGTNTETSKLSAITAVEGVGSTKTASDAEFPGYYAIDLFLRNSGLTSDDTQGTTKETLQLSSGSTLTVLADNGEATGLQNTPRIAFALYNGTADILAGQSDIITGTVTGKTISDVAMWEPNSNAHVNYIVTNYNDNVFLWNTADKNGYLAAAGTETSASSGKWKAAYTATEKLPTYALTSASVTAGSFTNLYDWSGTNASLEKQIALQTPAGATRNVNNLISVTSPESSLYTTDATDDAVEFQILKNTVVRLRMYVWLEGQDPDCVNYASHGGGIELDLGLCKGEDTSIVSGS